MIRICIKQDKKFQDYSRREASPQKFRKTRWKTNILNLKAKSNCDQILLERPYRSDQLNHYALIKL